MRLLKLQFIVAGILVLVAGVALADQSGVMLSTKPGLGSYLTDADGRTLYRFMKDAPGKSACVGQCVGNWPIFFRETMMPPAGLEAKDFDVITRDDGKKQTTFRGYPLYYYVADKVAGDAAGQGIGSAWFVIDPAAFAPKPMAPAAAPAKKSW